MCECKWEKLRLWPRDCAATPKGAGGVGEVGEASSRAASHFSSAEIAGSTHIDETKAESRRARGSSSSSSWWWGSSALANIDKDNNKEQEARNYATANHLTDFCCKLLLLLLLLLLRRRGRRFLVSICIVRWAGAALPDSPRTQRRLLHFNDNISRPRDVVGVHCSCGQTGLFFPSLIPLFLQFPVSVWLGLVVGVVGSLCFDLITLW